MEKRSGASAINVVFIIFMAGSVLAGAVAGKMEAVTQASFDAAKDAVSLALGLIGIMALWLGLVRVLEAGGLMYSLARMLRPLMTKLFPDVPPDHPAMGSMILNISANMLGLGNAATPFGVKAMTELNRLNPIKGTATNAMCLFLAINTSSVALLPLGVIGVRAAAGSSDPAAIFLPTLLATTLSTLVGIVAAKLLAWRDVDYRKLVGEQVEVDDGQLCDDRESSGSAYDHLVSPAGVFQKTTALLLMIIFMCAAFVMSYRASDLGDFLLREFVSYWLMPGLILGIVCYAMWRGVHMYEAVTEGAKQGFEMAVRIIPFLVAILVAIAMFRASGAFDLLAAIVQPLTAIIGMPPEVVPLAVVRPLSGSGAFGVMSAVVHNSPNSYSAYVASVMMGSTETTFYVLAVYFGAAGVIRIRHALVAGLLADVAGILCASLFSAVFWNG